jgi:hypothetical protein
VSRAEHGNGYIYRIMLPGEQYLDGTFTGSIGANGKSNGKRISSGKTSTEKSATATAAKKPSKSRPGGRELLMKLKNEGFFDSPKVIGDVISYATKNLGYTYKPTDLSTTFVRLVRDQELTRDTNENGQYEYTAK